MEKIRSRVRQRARRHWTPISSQKTQTHIIIIGKWCLRAMMAHHSAPALSKELNMRLTCVPFAWQSIHWGPERRCDRAGTGPRQRRGVYLQYFRWPHSLVVYA